MSRPDAEHGRGRHDVSPEMVGKTTGRREFDLSGLIAVAGVAGAIIFVGSHISERRIGKRPKK